MQKLLQIGVQVERSRAHGRALLEGLAEFARTQYDWRLTLLEPGQLTDISMLRRFDGFIARVMDEATAQALQKTQKPVIDVYGRNDKSPFTTLRLDDAAIAQMAATFYADRLCPSVAACGYPGLRFSDARMAAFAAEASERGIPCRIFEGPPRGRIHDTFFRAEQTGQVPDAAALDEWLGTLPRATAVFCCNDIRAFQLMKVCEAREIRVPHDLAVLGVDNDTLLCTFTASPLSSIDTNPFALGRRAGELLAERMEQPSKAVRTYLHPPRRVIERASTDAFRFSIPWLSDALVFIRRNLDRGVNAADVVRHLGYSHTTVNTAFRYELGTTVQQEIIRQRLTRACGLLRETTASAAQIAAETGFKTPQYFSKVFTETFHQTPAVWRRRNGR
ncbi:MAG: substrate-binding domain-containing protein [Kiritimatiellia bacterium]